MHALWVTANIQGRSIIQPLHVSFNGNQHKVQSYKYKFVCFFAKKKIVNNDSNSEMSSSQLINSPIYNYEHTKFETISEITPQLLYNDNATEEQYYWNLSPSDGQHKTLAANYQPSCCKKHKHLKRQMTKLHRMLIIDTSHAHPDPVYIAILYSYHS